MHFVDGNYSMVLQTKSKVQREEYSYFINKFIESVRKELAKSVEISYQSLTLKEAQEVFLIDNQRALEDFIKREQTN